MKLGFIGLGRMGRAMVLHLLEKGVDVVVFNRSPEKTQELLQDFEKTLQKNPFPPSPYGNLTPSYNLEQLIKNVSPPRIIWIMVEHGNPVESLIRGLLKAKLKVGDILIDGGNSFYKDSMKRHDQLKKKGIHFLDIGTSGGLEGARDGACLMIGGDEEIFIQLKDFFSTIATPSGFEYFGPSGSGHFVKMVHNGVEYGMLEAIGEGFELLAKSPFPIDLKRVAHNWSHGSIVRGFLMELLNRALANDPGLANVSGMVGGGTTGEWAVRTARRLKVEVPVIKTSLAARKKSVEKPTFSGKIVQALRFEFGGHK
ncbi:decarboxylating 6-phosphogluconate dehydrogenase [Candidatus Gottesmanbacteria bacterium]|nr:decarboxylating 6-phosphogluconate dehydrogenase [Candidatus Gottesmanbacteria bacterium]